MKELTYAEFIALAKEYYHYGGAPYVEHWSEEDYTHYVKVTGPVTSYRAFEMFSLNTATFIQDESQLEII